YLNNKIKKQFVKSISVSEIPNGIIVNEGLKGFGVFTKDKKFVKSSSQMREKNGQFIPKIKHIVEIPFVDEDVLFFGNVYPAFGHFLLEHMNRAWALLMDNYKNMKVVLINNKHCDVPEYMYKLIELIGVKRKNIIILDKTTQFRNVIVPDQGFNIPLYTSYGFKSVFDKISQNIEPLENVYEKIYVSRVALKTRKTYGEERVQKIFEQNGYHVVYPELLPLEKQIAYMKTCKSLAGCAGTALHLALFMPDGGQVIQIRRSKRKKCSATVQYLINNMKNIESVFISGSIESVKTDHFDSAPQIIGINKYMHQFFYDHGFKYSDEDLAFDKDAWKEYKNAMHYYKKTKGSVFMNNIKHLIVRLSAGFVPGRERRGRYRTWMKKILKQH
ncbi:MAG: glycosyltransferase family 61 protein, partial [Alphaproteobacteria bacterium]|nr:glycosyltransferase family 61 protein [Alphaproteobacteria bacterium]